MYESEYRETPEGQYNQYPPVSAWEWHNILALVLTGLWVLYQGFNWFQIADDYNNLPYYIQEEEVWTFGFISILAIWFLVTYVLAWVMIGMINSRISDPLSIRNAANWATWGLLLIGIGPFVAMARINRERLRRRYYSRPNRTPSRYYE